MKKDTRDIAKGALTNFTGVLLGTLNILFYIFLGRMYGPEVVGIFVFSRSSIDIISKLGVLGLEMGVLTGAAKSFAKKDSDAVYKQITQALTIGMIATLVVLLLLEVSLTPLTKMFPDRREYILPMRIMGFGMVFWTISSILLFATRALRIMKYEVIVKNGIEPGCIFFAAIVLYPFDVGILGISIAFLFSVFIGAVASAYFFSKEYSLRRVVASFPCLKGGGGLFRFSFPVGVYNTIDLLFQRIDLLILTQFAGPSSVGVYSMVQNTAITFRKIRLSFDPIIVPVISASLAVKDQAGLLLQYQNVTRWILILNVLFLGVSYFLAEYIMMVFGSEFSVGSQALVILTAAIMLNTFLGVSELFILIHRPFINLINTVVAVAAAAFFSYLFIPMYGISGAALAMLVSYALLNVIRLAEVRLMYKLQPFTGFHVRAMIAGAAAFFLANMVRTEFGEFQGAAVISLLIFLTLDYSFLLVLGMAEEERQAVSKGVIFVKNIFGKRTPKEVQLVQDEV